MPPQREWFEKDYYATLGVPNTASEKEITRAYRKLAKQNHPDTNPGDEAAEERFKDVSAAYDVLGDAEKRKEYDEVREMVAAGVAGPGFGRPGHGPGNDSGRTIFVADLGDLGDVGGLFGGLFGRGARRARADVPFPGPDLETELSLDFLEAVHGVMKELSFEGRTVKVRIPPGVRDGQRIRVKGRGGPGVNGGPPGDLYVVIHLKAHGVFKRDGDDLHCEMPISFTTAALGGEIEIPTLDGQAKIKIPAETQTGQVFRLRNKGIRPVRGSVTGDLYCHVALETPVKLTGRQKELLREFEAINQKDPAAHTPRAKSFFDRVKEFFGS